MEFPKVSHPVYKNINGTSGPAKAYGFLDKETFREFYYELDTLGQNQVRGRVLHVGMCHSDAFHGRSKWYPSLYPTSMGHEVVAEAIEVGPDVKNFKKGDIFLIGCMRSCCHKCTCCLKTNDNLCTGIETPKRLTFGLYFGGYGTHIQADEHWCFKAPQGLDLANAPPLMCAGVTTYAPLARLGKKGDKCVVIGIGGLGHLAVQFATKMGMEVVAFVSNLSSQEFVKGLGATKVVDWINGDLKEYENYFDIAINTLSFTPTIELATKLMSTLAPEAKYVQLGVGEASQPLYFPAFALIMKQLSIHGSAAGSRKETEEMLDFVVKNGVKVLCEHYTWEEFPKAFDKMENGKPIFRCVVDIDPVSKTFI